MIARTLLIFLLASVLSATAQTPQPAPAKQPLASIPYSPSLDLTNLDRTADPCVDFYQYTCGGWMKNNPIPPDQPAWNVYAKLADENSQFLWGILQKDAKLKDRTPVQQKIGDYFAACMNTDAINARGLEPLKPELERINAISSREQVAA
ncbi:MAG: M13 family peptidase, partial [Silvibacterium sp.]|nr:M13 family peptidase [Silvibacterium sp.]